MKGKTKIFALALALIIGSVAILTGSMYALAELPAEESDYDRSDFVDESLFVSDEAPAEEPAVEEPAEVVDETASEAASWEMFDFYSAPRPYDPVCGYAVVLDEPITWYMTELLDCFVRDLGYEYDYIVDWAFSEAYWRGNNLVIDVDLGEKLESYKNTYDVEVLLVPAVKPAAEKSAEEEATVEEPVVEEPVVEAPAAETPANEERPLASNLEEALAMTKIEVTEEGTWIEGRLVEGTVYEVLNFYLLPRPYDPVCGYAVVLDEPIVWTLSELLDCFVRDLGYDYDYIVDWAFSEAEWRGNILVVDVDLSK
ncbi:MAG: hypothetical protein J1E00_02930 [Oscillospiraceae bacterium]|nr:hypothetical protein [Oscillospiraceae bacterium]